MNMRVRERILTIRLMKKLQEHPAYAKIMGIEANIVQLKETTAKKERQV